MASQQTLIAETIRGMKVALKRRDNDSDSDTSIRQHTNRGNKLKRKAHFVREGRLDTSGGRSYRRKIEHAGYQRHIIHNNPPRFDEDGDLVEEDDEDEEAAGSPDEENPFEETKLEYLLAPLTSAAELANHPSLSLPYTSKHLSEMAESTRVMLHKERETLWNMKRLLQRFRGDEAWIPLERTETIHDGLLLESDGLDGLHDDRSFNESNITLERANDENILPGESSAVKVNGTERDLATVVAKLAQANGVHSQDMAMETSNDRDSHPNGHNGTTKAISGTTNGDEMILDGPDSKNTDSLKPTNPATNGAQANGAPNSDKDTGDSTEMLPDAPSHAMTTRRKARSPTPDSQASGAASPVPSSIPSINNFFLPPTSSLPDRDFGLPAPEAEETRRMLLLYVQKQEEVVRGVEQLFLRLTRADRLRHDVWTWCKAEGHVGELSDGEDWYDKEEWGLATDLQKGKEEEDVEDEGVRKGRRRRDPKKTTAGA